MPGPYTVKSCGKAHACCRICHPKMFAKLSAAIKAYANTPEVRKRLAKNGRMCKGSHRTLDQRALMSATRRGKTQSEQAVINNSKSQARRCRQHPTRWELALRRLLRGAGFVCRYERPFGRFFVDAYVPSRRIAFEADCEQRHEQDRRSGREEARDAYLAAEFGVTVVHLSRNDLRPFLLKEVNRSAPRTS